MERTEPLLEIHHDYADKSVHLDVHLVTAFTGEPRPQEGQPMVWAGIAELGNYAFPEANLDIVEALMQRRSS